MIFGIAPRQISNGKSPNSRRTKYGAALLTTGCTLIQLAPSAQSEDGLKLKQMTSACGPQNVLVSPSFFKVELPKKSLVLLGAAPNWKILTLNTRSKLFCETPLNKFNPSYITTPTQLHLTEIGLMQEDPSNKRARKIGGLAYIDYSVNQLDSTFTAFKDARAAGLRVIDDPRLPKAAGKVLKQLCGFNSIKTDQVPLTLEVLTKERMRDRFLFTTQITRVQNVKAEGAPKDYKRVGKEIDVFRDPQMQADIKDILDAH